jgi:hypothetical protein
MRISPVLPGIAAAALCTTLLAQQPPQAPSPQAPGAQGRGGQGAATPSAPMPRVFIYAGLKTHAVGQHDYPQFLADWSKILTERGAIVSGALQFPSARH